MAAVIAILGVLVIFWLFRSKQKNLASGNNVSFAPEWKIILVGKVAFYNSLNDEDKLRFELKICEFLGNCRITGIDVPVDDTDRILVAAGAVIPIFAFPQWQYVNIYEVLIYPSSFNERFETSGPDRTILGMVGNGYMEGKMILSKPALHLGFSNSTDKQNTVVHEFIHLIDKSDGEIDGIPAVLMDKQYALPWLDLINKKIEEIYKNSSDINPYGATNRTEFFAVASEYFFEQPKLLEKKHPELYALLEKMFNQKMTAKELSRQRTEIGRNDPCPCNSGKKFKKCCGSIHYAK